METPNLQKINPVDVYLFYLITVNQEIKINAIINNLTPKIQALQNETTDFINITNPDLATSHTEISMNMNCSICYLVAPDIETFRYLFNIGFSLNNYQGVIKII